MDCRVKPGNDASFYTDCPMPYDDDWQRRQRARWLRHDAHLWIRHDAARFVRPGFDPADVFPTLARKGDEARRRAEAAQAVEDAAPAAEIEHWRRVQAAIQAELNEVKAEMARRRALDAKYSPTQPRVPPGNPRGGQWTDRSGGQGTGQVVGQDAGQGDLASLTQPMGNVDIGDVTGSSELGDLFQIKPADTRVDGVQLAADGYPVDLLEDRELGGHAIEGHLRSDQRLKSDLAARIAEAVRKGDSTGDMRQGSFTSLEAANKLVNATIARNSEKVDRVVKGGSPKEQLDADFPAATG